MLMAQISPRVQGPVLFVPLEHIILQSHLIWREFSAFTAAIVNHYN